MTTSIRMLCIAMLMFALPHCGRAQAESVPPPQADQASAHHNKRARASHPRRAVDTTYAAVATKESDGDTLYLQAIAPDGTPSGQPEKSRSSDADAPEKCQPWGEESTQALHKLVAGKPLKVVVTGYDNTQDQRPLVKIYVDKQDVWKQMVLNGDAWNYQGYRGAHAGRYGQEEASAMARHVGLFSLPHPQRPYDWKHEPGHEPGRPCQKSAQ